MFKKNRNIVLSPLKNNPNVNELFGMFNDGKLSSKDFIKEKALEKEMENEYSSPLPSSPLRPLRLCVLCVRNSE